MEEAMTATEYRGFKIERDDKGKTTIRNPYGYPVVVAAISVKTAEKLIDGMLDR